MGNTEKNIAFFRHGGWKEESLSEFVPATICPCLLAALVFCPFTAFLPSTVYYTGSIIVQCTNNTSYYGQL